MTYQEPLFQSLLFLAKAEWFNKCSFQTLRNYLVTQWFPVFWPSGVFFLVNSFIKDLCCLQRSLKYIIKHILSSSRVCRICSTLYWCCIGKNHHWWFIRCHWSVNWGTLDKSAVNFRDPRKQSKNYPVCLSPKNTFLAYAGSLWQRLRTATSKTALSETASWILLI